MRTIGTIDLTAYGQVDILNTFRSDKFPTLCANHI